MKTIKSFRLEKWDLDDLRKYSSIENTTMTALLERALHMLFNELSRKHSKK